MVVLIEHFAPRARQGRAREDPVLIVDRRAYVDECGCEAFVGMRIDKMQPVILALASEPKCRPRVARFYELVQQRMPSSPTLDVLVKLADEVLTEVHVGRTT